MRYYQSESLVWRTRDAGLIWSDQIFSPRHSGGSPSGPTGYDQKKSSMNTLQILRSTDYPETTQTISARDAMLYALGIGFGDDPLDSFQLEFVYEKNLQLFPAMA